MKIATIVGARPQFIKAAPLSRALRKTHTEVLIHTGQHYDAQMSQVFFDELQMPAPDHYLGVGGGTHGAQTGRMLAAIEEVLMQESPDCVLVYGDTNSTLAGALAAAKLNIPLAHVEAGLRSFNRAMPEEVNRIVADRLSQILFAPSPGAVAQLRAEGITGGVYDVGDIMLDVVRMHASSAARSTILATHDLAAGGYYLCTIHRAENTDSEERLTAIFAALGELDMPVVLPLHPRTAGRIAAFGIVAGGNVRVIEPCSYIDMLALTQAAACVITDSGGLQKEAYYVGRPCVTVREETEWPETVANGANILAAADRAAIVAAIAEVRRRQSPYAPLYGDGRTAEKIAQLLSATFDGGRFIEPAELARTASFDTALRDS